MLKSSGKTPIEFLFIITDLRAFELFIINFIKYTRSRPLRAKTTRKNTGGKADGEADEETGEKGQNTL
jgi:hypothetical protein